MNQSSVITRLGTAPRTFLKHHSKYNDMEIVGSQWLNFATEILREAEESLEQKFLEDELLALEQFIDEGGYSLFNLPTPEELSTPFERSKLLSSQVKDLSKAEIFWLVFRQNEHKMQERIEGKAEYLSIAEFGRRLNPPRSRTRMLQLCKANRVTGATKNEKGEWELPVSSLKQVEEALNPIREQTYAKFQEVGKNTRKARR